MIDNFEPKIKHFILEKEKELCYNFVGCLESDDSLVFVGKNVGDIRVIDIVYCQNSRCEEYKIPQVIESINQHSWKMKCSNCLESYYPEYEEEED